jgi:LPXTG-motif cell wall-anchored protein
MRARPGRLIIAAACCAALAAVPASVAQATSTGGALSTGVGGTLSTGVSSTTAPPRTSPAAVRLIAAPSRPAVGRPVRVSVSAVPPGASGFAWDLAGRGAFTRRTAGPETVVSFTTPGTHTVAVRFRHLGHTMLGVTTVIVGPRSRPAPRQQSRSATRARSRPRPAVRRVSSGLTGRVSAHVAGDPGVTIADFHFSPATTTIHAGDTITWSNSGPSSHTATATNGGFNTGILKKGQSASHTFTQPGTFAYACQIHPFMHGTIIVLASTTSTSSGSTTPATTTPATTTPASTPSPTTTAAAQTGPTLPNTGFNVLAGLLFGLALVGLGAALRRTRAR